MYKQCNLRRKKRVLQRYPSGLTPVGKFNAPDAMISVKLARPNQCGVFIQMMINLDGIDGIKNNHDANKKYYT